MNLADKLGMSGKEISIDWELTPQMSFSFFESWGGRERVPDSFEMFYYFYIDNYSSPPTLYLMERAVKHAQLLAWIEAPQELLARCIAEQGYDIRDKNYTINATLKEWLEANIMSGRHLDLVHRLTPEPQEAPATGLPGKDEPHPPITRIDLRSVGTVVSVEETTGIVKSYNFYDSRQNPTGCFENYLVDNQDGLTISDLTTGLMWQRGGTSITSIKTMTNKRIPALNQEKFAGFNDWRLPTMEEALSLLEQTANRNGQHLHPGFSEEQGYIFLSDRRKPGGYWFVDFGQAMVFWASGTIPGGFGRVCRRL